MEETGAKAEEFLPAGKGLLMPRTVPARGKDIGFYEEDHEKIWIPVLLFLLFEAIAISLRVIKDNLFYLFDFS